MTWMSSACRSFSQSCIPNNVLSSFIFGEFARKKGFPVALEVSLRSCSDAALAHLQATLVQSIHDECIVSGVQGESNRQCNLDSPLPAKDKLMSTIHCLITTSLAAGLADAILPTLKPGSDL